MSIVRQRRWRSPVVDWLLVALSLALLAVLAWFIYVPTFQNPVNLYDEGLMIAGAERVANGAVLYRDVFTMYGPLPYLLTAAGFLLWEPNIVVWRALIALSEFALAVLAFVAVRRFAPLALALACALTFLFFRSSAWGLVLPLAGLLIAIDGRRRPWRLATGAGVIALGAAVKHEVAAFALAGVAIVLVADWWLSGRRERLVRPLLVAAGGALAGIAPLFLYLVLTGALSFALHDLLIVASRQINAVALPWPTLQGALEDGISEAMRQVRWATFVQFWAPFLVLPFAVWYAVLARSQPDLASFDWRLAVALGVFGLLLLNSQMVRSDESHILFASLGARILAFGVVWWAVVRARTRGRVALAAVATTLALLVTGNILLSTLSQLGHIDRQSEAARVLPAVNLDRLPVHEGPTNAALFPQVRGLAAQLSSPGDRLLVLPGSQPVMQFIAERPAPDRYDWIIEGVLTDVDRAALLARLEARPPDLVLLLSGEGGDWPVLRARLHALDSEPLLDWVLARYRVATIGNDVAFLVPR